MALMTGNTKAAQSAGGNDLRIFVFALFFIFGGITSLNDVVIPKLKALFTLNYAEAMLVQSAFFAAYFIISLPAAEIVKRFGYMRTAVVGLVTMTIGCLLFVPASASGQFGMFLFALFVLAAGITTVQVVANPLISMLGNPATAHSRLTFAQAFNSLGTTIFPYVGSILILGSLSTVDPAKLSGAALDSFRAVETQVVEHTYLGLAAALAVVAAVVWFERKRLVEAPGEPGSYRRGLRPARASTLRIRRSLHLSLCRCGSRDRLTDGQLLDAGERARGRRGGCRKARALLLGRRDGRPVHRDLLPAGLLAGQGAWPVSRPRRSLLLISANSVGFISGYALLAVGLCNSIMFPTIFSLASEKLGDRTAEGSGIICMAIVGGAIVPLITGGFADLTSLKFALVVPAVCYATILSFGWYARRPA
jgi:MFS transporter, FHS family, L-fucose permease